MPPRRTQAPPQIVEVTTEEPSTPPIHSPSPPPVAGDPFQSLWDESKYSSFHLGLY